MSAYRARRRGSFLGRFTFGGRMPPGLGILFAVVLALTVVAWLERSLVDWVALEPAALVFGGELWRLVSWSLFAGDPLGLFLGGLALWFTVPAISYRWSTARLLAVYLGFAAGASLVTALLYVAVPPARPLLHHVGWWPVIDGLMMLWALWNLDTQFSFWGIVPMTGRTFAWLILVGNVLYGLYAGGLRGLVSFTPYFATLAIAWVGARGRFPTRRWRMQWNDFWSERSFRRRAKHLKVVRKDGQAGPKQWLN